MIFSIAMGAEFLSYVKFIATFAPTFYGYIISVLASVCIDNWMKAFNQKYSCIGVLYGNTGCGETK